MEEIITFTEYLAQAKERMKYVPGKKENFSLDELEHVQTGVNRTKTLLRYARSLLKRHYDEDEAWHAICLANNGFTDPLTEEKLKDIFKSATHYAKEDGDDIELPQKDILNFATGEDKNLPPEKSLIITTQQEGSTSTVKIPWPHPMADEAFIGLAGQVVKLIEPHTEADHHALLMSYLGAFGNAIGDNAYFKIGSTRHHCILFSCFVGRTAKARKGTSWDEIAALFKAVVPEWIATGGLSSGEGLIWEVRDAIYRLNKKGEQEVIDSGVSDKRRLLVEPEFASVLHVMAREKNTLSSIIRKAWENGNLRSMTKNSPAMATKAHISIIGHITEDELLRFLSDTDMANGFGNRFLWFCVKRSKLLPRGGGSFDIALQFLLHTRLAEAITFAQSAGEITMSEEAWKIWDDIYEGLSAEIPGIVGSMLGRIEAYARRLSVLYALLDKSTVVLPIHLLAALAILDYVFDSVSYIFQNKTGDSTADKILTQLASAPHGMTLTDISNLFSRHEKEGRISSAIEYLLQLNRIVKRTVATGGRPITLLSLNPLFSQSGRTNSYLLQAKNIAKQHNIIIGESSEESEEIDEESVIHFDNQSEDKPKPASEPQLTDFSVVIAGDDIDMTKKANDITKDNKFITEINGVEVE